MALKLVDFLFILLFVSQSYSISFPLRTNSRWIVDSTGTRVKFACVNWYGADEKDFVVAGLHVNTIPNIAKIIKAFGFNCVRLPWSNELIEKNPVVTNTTVLRANPNLVGLHAMDILDKVVQELSNQNLMIILDNHMSDSDWCCNENDGNGLWYNARYPESNWLQDWKNIVSRYMKNPYVVGADLRNELRKSCGPFLSFNGEIMRECRNPTWGSGSIEVDWHRAATNAGNTILSVNPNLLIIVEGLNYALDLTGAYSKPISFNIPNRLVYEAHDYSWDHPYLNNFVELSTELGDKWGFLLKQNQPYTAPVWVGEFGTCHSSADCVTGTSKQGRWFTFLGQYLANADID